MEDTLIGRLLFNNWQRKIVAILTAVILWLFVNNSITETKTIPNVPIRIINLPPDKTIVGLLPNRLLTKRVTLTLSGTKDVIQELEPGDLEVLLDVSTADNDDWVVKINKKNLVSLNPSIDLLHHITQVDHAEFVLKLTPLVTEKIPIRILEPTGSPPTGYDFLDLWPQKLLQTVSGPQEEVEKLKTTGLELVFNLNEITREELDALKSQQASSHDGEVSFMVPEKWKKVAIPFRNYVLEEINDPEAKTLHIDFLRKDFLKVNDQIAIRVFYPFKSSQQVNASTHPLAIDQNLIKEVNGITFLNVPLYVKDVSRLFVDIIRENIEIDVVAAPKSEREYLKWSLEVIDPHELEDTYVAYMLNDVKGDGDTIRKQESLLRKRFKEYMQELVLYEEPERKLELHPVLTENNIRVNIVK